MQLKRITLLALVVLLLVGTSLSAHSHSHGHSHDHDHDHSHDHEHSHSHTHSNTAKTNTKKAEPKVQAEIPTEKTQTKKDVETPKQKRDDPVIASTDDGAINDYINYALTSAGGGVWTSAILATVAIGVLPIFILTFIPLIKEESTASGASRVTVNKSLLKTFLSFAVGGLLGDVFLHLLPHAMMAQGEAESHSHSHSHSHEHSEEHGPHDLSMGLLLLGGLLTFFILEKYMRLKGGDRGHSHSHSHGHAKEEEKETSKNIKKRSVNNTPTEKKEKTENKKKSTDEEEHKKVTGYLNIIADTAHNFTDGMAIGASFLVSQKVGISTTVAVFFHEIPHEIGDYAILIQSGFTKKQAMLVQLWTAGGAVAGTIVALLAGGYLDSINWVLPFTAGGFIYIATVNVIPELLEEVTVSQTIKELIGIGSGIGMMALIAIYE